MTTAHQPAAGGCPIGQRDDSFHTVVQQHQSMVFSIAYRMLGDFGIAEEVAQDVFLELFRVQDRMESDDHVRFWLRRTATHRATDAIRRRKVRPEASAEVWEERFDVPDSRGSRHTDRSNAVSARLECALLTLPDVQRAAVVLRYQEEMTPAEIARVTGESIAAVKSNLQRGMALLRRKSEVLLKEFVRGV